MSGIGDVRNETVLVVGGTRVIGRAVASRFAADRLYLQTNEG